MKNWSPFPCDQLVLDQLQAWYRLIKPTRLSTVSWQSADVPLLKYKCPALAQRVAAAGRRIEYAATITKSSNEPPFIHVDHMPGVEARLLFPISNTEGSYTAFYSSTVPPTESSFQGALKAYVLKEEECVEIERVHMVQPIVLRITTPHAIICNPRLGPRVTLTLRLDQDPVDLL